ncbi:uncharacterized protein EI97DRAFT_218000 [Westerdykella ornata]|uniref:Uncharacterized protein n=1 Tax=Westerdykella ornata TaxID=318751 RepID=A0A6A6JR68_WESOR|nr:uncharacterized protein EI97DRAFT_218000 [Westerdykella ornata]KAF2278744.1 hypothetical protein EI97DRAFT_218000 [Westerdykella ornata]
MTTIALDDLQPGTGTTLRRRADSRQQDANTDTSSVPTNRSDALSTAPPQDSPSFQPTNFYWISWHGLLPPYNIEVFDLTSDISTPFTGFTESFQNEVQRIRKDHTSTPFFTAHPDNRFCTRYGIRDSQGDIIAQWQHPWITTGKTVFSFPEGSPYCSHPVHLAHDNMLKNLLALRTESFSYNSAKFVWTIDSRWHAHRMSLYRVWGSGPGQKRIEVGRWAQKWGLRPEGILVVDEREVSGLVACLTLLALMKKKRHEGGGG